MKKIILIASILATITLFNFSNIIYYKISNEYRQPFFISIIENCLNKNNEMLNEYFQNEQIKIRQTSRLEPDNYFSGEVKIRIENTQNFYSTYFYFKSDKKTINQIILKGVYVDKKLFEFNKDLGVLRTFYFKNRFEKNILKKTSCRYTIFGFPEVMFN